MGEREEHALSTMCQAHMYVYNFPSTLQPPALGGALSQAAEVRAGGADISTRPGRGARSARTSPAEGLAPEQELRTLTEQAKWEVAGPGRLTLKRPAHAQRRRQRIPLRATHPNCTVTRDEIGSVQTKAPGAHLFLDGHSAFSAFEAGESEKGE